MIITIEMVIMDYAKKWIYLASIFATGFFPFLEFIRAHPHLLVGLFSPKSFAMIAYWLIYFSDAIRFFSVSSIIILIILVHNAFQKFSIKIN